MVLKILRYLHITTWLSIVYVVLFTYYIQNGFWLPQPLLVRHNAVKCPLVGRPKGLTNTSLGFKSSDVLQGNDCAWDIGGISKAHYRKAISNLKKTVDRSEQEIFKPLDYLPLHYTSLDLDNPVAFQPIDYTGGYVLSAFIDRRVERTPDVKVLYLVPFSSPTLYCQTYCENSYIAVKGRPMFLPYFSSAHHNCIWQQYLLHCLFPPICDIQNVSVTSSPCLTPTNSLQILETHAPYKSSTTFALCLNYIYRLGEKDLSLFVRAVESFLMIGGEKIYMYGMENVHSKIKAAVDFYIKRGVIIFYDWKVPSDVTSVFYYGQMLQHMDCLYRHMIDTEKLFYLDLDEIFIPIQHDNLTQLFSELKRDKAYAYEAGFHFKRILFSGSVRFDFSTARVQDLCREVEPKPVVSPRKTVQIGIHYMEQPLRPFSFGRTIAPDLAVAVHLSNNHSCEAMPSISISEETLLTITRKMKAIDERTSTALKTIFQ